MLRPGEQISKSFAFVRDFKPSGVLRVLNSFFWVIPLSLNFICRRFGTLCPTFIGPVKMEQSVPKRRHIKFILRRIAQKKEYNSDFLVCQLLIMPAR